MSENGKKLTRRDFLRNAGVIAGGATLGAGLLLGGCSNGNQQAAPANTEPPKEKEYWLPDEWHKETDVVVVGTGCGLAAAIEAKTAGADVIVLEKNDWVGGLWKTAGGHAILGATKVQKEYGIEDSLEAWYEDELKACGYRGVPELIKTYVEKGPELVTWMESMGFKWDKPTNANPEVHRANRSHWPAHNPGVYESKPNDIRSFGIAWITVWEKKLQELGVPILLKHRMTKIYRKPDGPVLGVEVDTPEGKINIKARKAVILCTGTWTDNYRMAQAWDPRAVGPDCYGDGGTPCDGTLFVDSAGDGHLAAAAIGAGFSDMSFVSYYYIFYGSRSYWGWDPPDFKTAAYYAAGKGINRTDAFFQRVILVKNDGTRYINEMEGARVADPSIGESGTINENIEWPYTAKYLSLPQPRNVWAITDSVGAEELKWPLDQIKNPNPKKGFMFDPACIAIADSIEELANKMGVSVEGLKQTIERYNSFVDAGEDKDFGKPMPLYKIATPPFYGLKASLIRHTQRNGLRVNTKSQVIEQSDQMTGYNGKAIDASISIDQEKVIPHLYAAGEIGNIMGWRRPHGSLGNYATAARIAGQNAAKETPWE